MQQQGLKSSTIGLMAGVALLYDVIQILLSWIGIGWLIIPIFYLHYWLWFGMHGVKFFTAKRARSLGIGALLEVFTAGIAPAFFVNVLTVALDAKIKQVASHVPGGNLALKAVDTKQNKANQAKNASGLNNVERMKAPSGNPEEIRAEMRKHSAEFNAKTAHFDKERERINKAREDFQQRQRKFEEDYGGYKKYDKDLSDIKFKYSDSEWKRRGGGLDKAA